MHKIPGRLLIAAAALSLALPAQEKVTIQVDVSSTVGPWSGVYRYFGYDEPNYTYMKDGRKLVGELTALSPRPVYFRAHHLLVTGDGTPALKWGSTNAYTEDASGNPVYDWTIVDRIFDTYIHAGGKPFVEIGFMPEALSTKPQPYRHTWPKGRIEAGWAYPPKDYAKWAGLVHAWVQHAVERYGKEEVETWWWELWNEPDIMYWKGTPEEYDKLYDYTADAVKRALPTARVGGPGVTGPRNPKATAFLRQFLDHCARGVNAVTGKPGAPLDFVSFHAKGAPKVVDGHVRMGTGAELESVSQGFQAVASYPGIARLPIIISEWDPEGCAACSVRTHPQNAYRNDTLYPANTAVVLRNTLELADRYHVNLEGVLTWAFEFEGQPYFDGFRTLATNGIDKPVLNFFRMAGQMGGKRVLVTSSGALPLDSMLKDGISGKPDVNAMATAREDSVSVMVWNYQDDETAGTAAPVELKISGLPPAVGNFLVKHYRIDEQHSNAYTVWKRMGSPQQPTPAQYAELESAGQLQLLESPRWVTGDKGTLGLNFSLPSHALSLVQLSW